MSSVELPPADVVEVEVDVRLEEIRRDELAPESDDALLRYLVYRGWIRRGRPGGHVRPAPPPVRCGRQPGAVLRFHYGEQARGFAEEKRAHASHERMAGAYEGLVEKMEAEIAVREERIRKLEAALER